MAKPVFNASADDKLLSKYFHGAIQYSSEASNNIIWARCFQTIC